MPTDLFLKIDGIPGDSTDAKHAGEIDLLSWSWGVSQTAAPVHAGGGAAAGKADVRALTIAKHVDRATPLLLRQCLTGKRAKEAVLAVRRAGGAAPLEYLRVKMRDVMVSSLEAGGSTSGDRPDETVTLSFASVELEYVPQKPDGSGDAAIVVRWDLARNAEV